MRVSLLHLHQPVAVLDLHGRLLLLPGRLPDHLSYRLCRDRNDMRAVHIELPYLLKHHEHMYQLYIRLLLDILVQPVRD